MLKRILFILTCIVFAVGNVAYAAEEQSYDYGFYSISNLKLVAQNSEKAIVRFEITNNTDNYYSELFCVPTLKINGDLELKNFYVPYYNYEAKEFTLEPRETKIISLDCAFPENMPNKSALISIDFYSKTNKISFSGETVFLNTIRPSFYGFIEGEYLPSWKLKNGEYVQAGSGPNVTIDELPQVRLNLTSTFSEEKTIYPQMLLYERSDIYNSKPIYNEVGDGIKFKAGEKKEVLVDVPGITKPESYLLKINFVDESGIAVSPVYDYRYVIKGESAKVSLITFSSTVSGKVVKVYAYGPADGGTLENAELEVLGYNESGNVIFNSKKNVILGNDETISEIHINGSITGKITVEAKISYEGNILTSKKEELNLEADGSTPKGVFTDIIGQRYEKAVKTLNGLGIINGYPDNTFKPDNLVTRAEFATIAVKLKELTVNENGTSLFTDIDNHWAKRYINTLYENGFVNGYPDGTYAPQNNVTYAEAFTILLNELGYKAEVNNSDQGWPYNYVSKAREVGLTETLSSYDAMSPANRGDIALITLQAYLLK